MFGFRYKISGVIGQDSITLRKVVKHPPFKNNKGEMETEYSIPLKKTPKGGAIVAQEGYGLGGGSLVPGKWTFEIWYEDQKLLSQSFTVVTR